MQEQSVNFIECQQTFKINKPRLQQQSVDIIGRQRTCKLKLAEL